MDERFQPPHSSIHIGLVHGGIAPNVIADKAQFHWDLRTIPKDDLDSIVQEYFAHSVRICASLHQKLAALSFVVKDRDVK